MDGYHSKQETGNGRKIIPRFFFSGYLYAYFHFDFF